MSEVTREQVKVLSNEFLPLASEDGVLDDKLWVFNVGGRSVRRALPPFCERYSARLAARHSRRIASYLVKHPDTNIVIVLDWNALEVWKKNEFTKGEELLG